MNRLILFCLLSLFSMSGFAQDVIFLNSGSRILCKVTSVDSVRAYYTFNLDGVERSSSVSMNLVKEIQYQPYQNEIAGGHLTQREIRQCITIGVLQGGGSLIGMDLELKMTDRIGIQAGFGYRGFGGGLNLHFKPGIRSSYLSLQYYHQGFGSWKYISGSSYTQSMIGPCVVFRGKKCLSAQLGLAALIETGPAWPKNKESAPVMLTYALGFYIPW